MKPDCEPLATEMEWNLLADASGYVVDDSSDLYD